MEARRSLRNSPRDLARGVHVPSDARREGFKPLRGEGSARESVSVMAAAARSAGHVRLPR